MARAKSESGNVEGWQSVFPPFEQLEKRGGEEERERERKKKLFLNVGKFETKNEDIVRMKLKFVKIHYPFWFRFFLFFFLENYLSWNSVVLSFTRYKRQDELSVHLIKRSE